MISISPLFNNSVINPPQLSSFGQQSSSSSHNTPCDNQCFNIKYSNSNSNELSSPVIPVPISLNYSVNNPPHLKDKVKSNRVLKKIATYALCYVKSWMTFDKQKTDEVDY